MTWDFDLYISPVLSVYYLHDVTTFPVSFRVGQDIVSCYSLIMLYFLYIVICVLYIVICYYMLYTDIYVPVCCRVGCGVLP